MMATKTKTLTERVARTLASDPDSQTCTEALDEIQARLQQINDRIKLIRPAPNMEIPAGLDPEQTRVLAQRDRPSPGAERAEAIGNGDTSTVRRLDEEYAALQAEEEVLVHQRERLQRARTAAKVTEGAEEARRIVGEVEGHADLLEAAAEAYTEARNTLRDALDRLREARKWGTGQHTTAIRAGIEGAPESDVPGVADEELLVRLRALLAKDLLDRPGIPKQRLQVDRRGRYAGSEEVVAPRDDRALGLLGVVVQK